MRLIDADLLQNQLTRKKAEVCKERYTDGFNDALMRFKSMVHGAPPVDAVPVVRCRECRHKYRAALSSTGFRCEIWGTYDADPECDPDGFCSYGERKDGCVNG